MAVVSHGKFVSIYDLTKQSWGNRHIEYPDNVVNLIRLKRYDWERDQPEHIESFKVRESKVVVQLANGDLYCNVTYEFKATANPKDLLA